MSTLTGSAPPATFQLQTPNRSSAVAVIEIQCDELDAWLQCTGLATIPSCCVKLCNLWDIDRALVARWSATCLHVMPHGGRMIMEELRNKLHALGAVEHVKSTSAFPESVDEIERRMLQALAQAASPRAVDLLLDQPERWRRVGVTTIVSPTDTPRDVLLRRALTPPLVAAWGRPNIGKSSLINALAQRDIAIVADVAGTTRDHVGVVLELDGLTLRYIDTPGVSDAVVSDLEPRAVRLSWIAVQSADLILHCGDAMNLPPPLPVSISAHSVLRVALRSDLGRASWPHELSVCVATGQGLQELAVRIRQALIPDAALLDRAPWKFWVS